MPLIGTTRNLLFALSPPRAKPAQEGHPVRRLVEPGGSEGGPRRFAALRAVISFKKRSAAYRFRSAPLRARLATMKRGFRIVWVLAANGSIAALTPSRYSGELYSLHLESLLELVLEFLFPFLGIAVELFGWKSAKWVNVGYLLAAGCFWLGEGIWWRSDSFFFVLLLMSLIFFTLAGITEVVYRRTASTS
jgi:hypothetical protein